MNDFIKTAGMLVIRGDHVLLVKHSEHANHPTGHYGFPAGKLEGGESRQECAVRELEEETGLISEPSDLIEVHRNGPRPLQMKNGIKNFDFVLYTTDKFTGEIKETREGIPEWIEVSNVSNLKTVGDTAKIIQNYYA